MSLHQSGTANRCVRRNGIEERRALDATNVRVARVTDRGQDKKVPYHDKAMSGMISDPAVKPELSTMRQRANALANRLEQGARALATFASALTEAEWQTRVPKDGRKVGVVVHHVASMYPLEIQVAQTLARGEPVAGVTWDAVAEINAGHAKEHDDVTKERTLDLLQRNSAAAAAAIRALSDE